LQLDGQQVFTHDSPGVPGEASTDDRFGAALVAADFTGDGRDDLAVGSPYEDIGAFVNAGAVTVLFGSATGLTGDGAQSLNQDSPGAPDSSESGDHFGVALAAGDVTGDGHLDLVVGAPGEDIGAVPNAGAVTLFLGNGSGLTGSGPQSIDQDSAGVPGSGEASDKFGEVLAVGDLNGDDHADVAIGAPHEDIGVGQGGSAGSVTVLYGAGTGLSATGAQAWTQDSPGLPTKARSAEVFGFSLRIAPLRSGAIASLLIGVPVQYFYKGFTRGVVHVLRGSATGVTGSGSRVIKSAAQRGYYEEGWFGWCLT
jgi:hypothetical protein